MTVTYRGSWAAQQIVLDASKITSGGIEMKPWPGDGETYDLCVGCDRTPNRRLMAFDQAGRYLCRNCREKGTR